MGKGHVFDLNKGARGWSAAWSTAMYSQTSTNKCHLHHPPVITILIGGIIIYVYIYIPFPVMASKFMTLF